MLSPGVRSQLVGLVLWGAALLATLSLAHITSTKLPSICGPWGCGPPTEALVAVHLSWLVVLLPPAMWIWRRPAIQSLGRWLWLVWLVPPLVVGGVAAYEAWTWWPRVSDSLHVYFPKRVAFSLVATTDVPLLSILLLAMILPLACRWSESRPKNAAE